MYSFKYTNKMHRYKIFFIAVNALHVSGGFSSHRQELKTVHTASGICQACLLLLLVWVSWNSATLAVAASKLDIYQTLCVQFWAPDDGQRNRLKHVEHWWQWRIFYNVPSCWYTWKNTDICTYNECLIIEVNWIIQIKLSVSIMLNIVYLFNSSISVPTQSSRTFIHLFHFGMNEESP